jgi:hypothetical protein
MSQINYILLQVSSLIILILILLFINSYSSDNTITLSKQSVLLSFNKM